MSNFGKTIHNLRTRRKMTQQELAQDLFDRSTILKLKIMNYQLLMKMKSN